MQVKIGKPTSRKNPKNMFVVTMKFMHGDADAHTDEVIGKFNADTRSNKDGTLEEMLELCDRIKSMPVNRHDEDDFYAMLETFPKYEDFGIDWPGDSTTDYQYPAEYDGHYVRYFDADGIEHEVTYG